MVYNFTFENEQEINFSFPIFFYNFKQKVSTASVHYLTKDEDEIIATYTKELKDSKISELSSNYTPPTHACNTYKVTFALLKEFEDDLHQHIHLENNILFPKAIKLETEFH